MFKGQEPVPRLPCCEHLFSQQPGCTARACASAPGPAKRLPRCSTRSSSQFQVRYAEIRTHCLQPSCHATSRTSGSPQRSIHSALCVSGDQKGKPHQKAIPWQKKRLCVGPRRSSQAACAWLDVLYTKIGLLCTSSRQVFINPFSHH